MLAELLQTGTSFPELSEKLGKLKVLEIPKIHWRWRSFCNFTTSQLNYIFLLGIFGVKVFWKPVLKLPSVGARTNLLFSMVPKYSIVMQVTYQRNTTYLVEYFQKTISSSVMNNLLAMSFNWSNSTIKATEQFFSQLFFLDFSFLINLVSLNRFHT